jgi:hypothetical protein
MEFRLLGIGDYTCRDESDEQDRRRAGFSLLCERLVVAETSHCPDMMARGCY